jgi:hypothetical protein
MLWADFPGAHGLEFGGPENSIPVPSEALEQYEWPDIPDREPRFKRRQKLLEELMPFDQDASDRSMHFDLASLRGHAGIILPDEQGAFYSWQCDGVSLSWRSCQGYYIPLGRPAPKLLHTWGDNVYTNDGTLDADLIDTLLAEVLPGWKVDMTVEDASCEACVFLVCERDVYPSWDRMDTAEFREKFGPTPPEHQSSRNPDYDGRQAEWIRSPLANEYESRQTGLVGKRAVLVWGNSD